MKYTSILFNGGKGCYCYRFDDTFEYYSMVAKGTTVIDLMMHLDR